MTSGLSSPPHWHPCSAPGRAGECALSRSSGEQRAGPWKASSRCSREWSVLATSGHAPRVEGRLRGAQAPPEGLQQPPRPDTQGGTRLLQLDTLTSTLFGLLSRIPGGQVLGPGQGRGRTLGHHPPQRAQCGWGHSPKGEQGAMTKRPLSGC